ncbi:HD domain-containing protein [Sphingomonas montana]|uniref:HD domain-containing protein n=1 Tax=Sphingomonas montana TaxID=1843236 RepID=UPI00096E6AA4|nr:HD domain-containing protein [Sphingomonas montana]
MTDARSFAIAAHGDQLYGGAPYETHLQAVVQVVRDFGYGDAFEQAAWLHDVVEDTAIDLAEIRERFGEEVAAMVDAVTGTGETRADQTGRIYAGLAACPAAAIVKLADRIANVEAAPMGSAHAARYRREAEAFAAVVEPRVPPTMWARLTRALARAEG